MVRAQRRVRVQHRIDKVQPGTWKPPVSDGPLGTPLQLSAVPLSYSTMCMPQLIADYAVRPTDLAWTVVIQNLFGESDDNMHMKHRLLYDPDYANTLQRKPLDPGERAVRLVRAWQHVELNMRPLQEQQYEVLQLPFGYIVSLLEPQGHDLMIGVQPPPDGWPSFKTFLPHGYLDVPGFFKGPDDVANVRRFSDTAYHPHALFRMRQRFEDEGKKAAAARLLRSQLAHATSEADEDERRRGDRRSREDAGRLDRDFGQPWGTVPWSRSAPTAEHVDMARRTTNGEGSPRIPRYPGATAIAQRDRMEIKRSRTAPYEVPPTAYLVGYDAVPASVADPNYRYEGRRRTAAHTEPIHAHAQQEPIRRAFAEEYGWRHGDESGFEAPRWDSGASAYAAGANDWYVGQPRPGYDVPAVQPPGVPFAYAQGSRPCGAPVMQPYEVLPAQHAQVYGAPPVYAQTPTYFPSHAHTAGQGCRGQVFDHWQQPVRELSAQTYVEGDERRGSAHLRQYVGPASSLIPVRGPPGYGRIPLRPSAHVLAPPGHTPVQYAQSGLVRGGDYDEQWPEQRDEQTYVYPPNESNEYDPENWRMI
ncbi:hypothetical protein FVE85_9655 [Porphyridium purpureum]|uniref:Uncharacterized protein n=1 Tax=Porphyridium purpureum TaxID=35688 RepID=A0A5J4YK37_PORPP|nr:hypothetical protein FVE85_9655 [Porphyridium purpureum]|eukprot:POR3692..scf246_12